MTYSACPQLLSPLLSFVFFFNPSFLLDSDFIIIVIQRLCHYQAIIF